MKVRLATVFMIMIMTAAGFAQSDGELVWNKDFGGMWYRGAAIRDNTIYFGSEGGSVYAIDFEGEILWEFTPGLDQFDDAPCIAPDGTIYVGNEDSYLYALNPDGTEKWKFLCENAFMHTPALADDGTIYIGEGNGIMYAINPDGTLKWQYTAVGFIEDSPSIGLDGTIYFSTLESILYALSPGGELKWRIELDAEYISTPTIDSDGTIYIATNTNGFFAINPDGAIKWHIENLNTSGEAVVIGPAGRLYISAQDNNLYALDRDGNTIWTFEVHASTPIIGADSTIYVGSSDNNIYAINHDGSEKWKYKASGNLKVSAITNTGLIIAESFSGSGYNKTGSMYVLQTESMGLADSPWPKNHKNVSCTSNSYNIDSPQVVLNPKESYIKSNETLTLDASQSFASDGGALTFSWIVLEKPENSVVTIADSTSSITTVSFDSNDFGNYKFAVTVSNQENLVSADVMNAFYGPINWTFYTFGEISASATLDYDSEVYIGSTIGNSYSFDSDGGLNWQTDEFGYVLASNTIGPDNELYIPAGYGHLYKIDNDGQEVWNAYLSGNLRGSASVGKDSTIYITSEGRYLFAINPDGSQKWTVPAGGRIYTTPSIAQDGTIYFGSNDGILYAVNPDGSVKWKYDTGKYVRSSAAIDYDGTIYFGSNDGNLYALNSDGTVKWKYQTGDKVTSSPSIGADSTIYVGSLDQNLYALNNNGTLKWQYETGAAIESSPTVGYDGMIYVGSSDKNVYAIHPDGTLNWKYTTSGEVVSSPSLDMNGKLYIGSNDGNFYCLQTESYGLADSPWPKLGCNYQNTSFMSVEPTANFIAEPTNGISPLQVEFQDLSTGYISEWLWDFGDGYTSTEQNPVHVYETSDSFSVSLTVEGPDGSNTLVKENYIIINEAQPVAAFTADTTGGIAPLTVQFADSSTGTITEWSWDFGDGETSSEQNPEHTYTVADTFSVSLSVSGPGGSDTCVNTNYIIVIEPAPIAAFAVDSTAGAYPFTVQFSDSSSGVITEWLWDFGDGCTSDEQNPLHEYTTADSFTVSLTVTGPGGSDTMIKEKLIVVDHPTGIEDAGALPTRFNLYQNYPNPFNPTTHISFDLPKSAFVELSIYNSNGQLVDRLISENRTAGTHQINWNGVNHSSGLYYFKIKAGDFLDMKKMILIK